MNFAFDVACQVLDNSEQGKVPYNPPAITARKIILYLLLGHLCELKTRGDGIVGNMSSASQGSVSAAFSAPSNPGGGANACWFKQTQCGATAWQLLSSYVNGGKIYRGS